MLSGLVAVVEDVLDRGEAEGDDSRVRDAVDDAVELAAEEQEDEEHGKALGGLLDEGAEMLAETRAASSLFPVAPATSASESEFDDAREEGGGPCSPEKDTHENPHWLGVVAIDPEPDEQVEGRWRKREEGTRQCRREWHGEEREQ